MAALVLAFSISDRIEKYGAICGYAAILGLAVLSLLYFAQAREVKRLREWAGRAPERAQDLQDRVMAQAMGIPVPWVYTGVFAIGAALAAASGVLFAPMAGVTHTMGLDWVLKAFIVVVVGGMGSLGGSIAAAIFISLLEAYAAIWVSPAQAVIVSFIVLILTLLFRPTGLFVPTPK